MGQRSHVSTLCLQLRDMEDAKATAGAEFFSRIRLLVADYCSTPDEARRLHDLLLEELGRTESQAAVTSLQTMAGAAAFCSTFPFSRALDRRDHELLVAAALIDETARQAIAQGAPTDLVQEPRQRSGVEG